MRWPGPCPGPRVGRVTRPDDLWPSAGPWQPVTTGESGAAVFRSADGGRYAKSVTGAERSALAGERDRVIWLAGQGVPGPRVLDWRDTDDGAVLVTSAVPGVPADQVGLGTLRAAWEAIADAVRALHGLPLAGCPAGRDLRTMYRLARDVVARGAVNPEFLSEEQRGTPPAELLARLTPQLDHRLAQEADDAVVCHGDLTLPNILLDPDTARVTGFIDLGRLGRADPYADLALLFGTAREAGLDGAASFTRRYGIAHDPGRERFYRHLDPLTWG
ncbi:APH(3'') family aminoglycoside O-phosphotransferase [Streptomyces carpaticus]|uniref:APH(3'') family aminoglycoside O-phosphotransferase n=1 Tax=Streptomyces carpaticus TaxID=285558 RepID=A0ABV4ZKK0_9ACTN